MRWAAVGNGHQRATDDEVRCARRDRSVPTAAPALAIPVAVVKRFSDDRAGRLAALIAYYGFFSIFPAMLALVTVLGFVLEGRDDLRQDIANSRSRSFR